ncbi:uncharacterized protein TNCV_4952091 [Trichonephila clavipes]|nr:uncharacterized protein TNCV_4952091 [Trichonephila clavipes]
MQYLLQSVEPHSKALRLVLSVPTTAANYSKAIEQLKERACNENAVKGWYKTDLTFLYDELEGKLRALESLKRNHEKYGYFLIPLVESCLSVETLLAWERSRNHESTQNTRSLEHLMNFLRKEVQGEEMVQLTRTGFGPQHNFRKNNAPVKCVRQSELATASALVSLDAEKENVRSENSLSNCSRSGDAMFLQTLCVVVKLQGVKKRVRALIDSASQSSYISERLVNQSVVQPLRTGRCYGKTVDGNVVTLHFGLTAVESKLGWTVFGKRKFCGKDKFTTTLSMHVGNIPLQNLWELEVLGITDPTETVKEKEDVSDFRGKNENSP